MRRAYIGFDQRFKSMGQTKLQKFQQKKASEEALFDAMQV
jgi:hypothetical protein